MNTPILRRAAPTDAAIVLDIFQQCARDMRDRLGMTNWESWLDWTETRMVAELARVDLYLVEVDGEVAATFSIQPNPLGYFDMTLWHEPDADAIYLRRLGVKPAFQGRTLGDWCLRACEALARQKGYSVVRFDADAHATRLLAFYERHGYQRRGQVVFNAALDQVFECFEKRLA